MYTVSGHAILTPKAASLEPPAFAAYQVLAETLLRKNGLPLVEVATEPERGLVELALAIQINFEVEQGIDPFVYSRVRSSHTNQEAVYRYELVDPRAVEILSSLFVEGSVNNYGATLTSRRTEGFASMRGYR